MRQKFFRQKFIPSKISGITVCSLASCGTYELLLLLIFIGWLALRWPLNKHLNGLWLSTWQADKQAIKQASNQAIKQANFQSCTANSIWWGSLRLASIKTLGSDAIHSVEATVPQNLFLDKVLTNLEGIGTLPEEYTIQTNNDIAPKSHAQLGPH